MFDLFFFHDSELIIAWTKICIVNDFEWQLGVCLWRDRIIQQVSEANVFRENVGKYRKEAIKDNRYTWASIDQLITAKSTLVIPSRDHSRFQSNYRKAVFFWRRKHQLSIKEQKSQIASCHKPFTIPIFTNAPDLLWHREPVNYPNKPKPID